LREREVRANESAPGFSVVSWYPYRADHPDYPGSTIDSAHARQEIIDHVAVAVTTLGDALEAISWSCATFPIGRRLV
jgi:hypothetical protein